ncbi:hypothetical protein H6P81_010236 [Aristolochia fimbriata]|uniref:Uncharacterized protein n=1 Tax=Aristolochia fimbriata TaxID=158543 RepID=A0AAV7ERL4_ARIFI|nr:hypothetical protein H6P81_010236 [Aristolochia fimbriata]
MAILNISALLTHRHRSPYPPPSSPSEITAPPATALTTKQSRFPEGSYLTGTHFLKSGVVLDVEEDIGRNRAGKVSNGPAGMVRNRGGECDGCGYHGARKDQRPEFCFCGGVRSSEEHNEELESDGEIPRRRVPPLALAARTRNISLRHQSQRLRVLVVSTPSELIKWAFSIWVREWASPEYEVHERQFHFQKGGPNFRIGWVDYRPGCKGLARHPTVSGMENNKMRGKKGI